MLCNRCHRCKNDELLFPTILRGAKVCVVGHSPSIYDYRNRAAFTSNNGRELRNCIDDCGIDSAAEVSYTHCLFCCDTDKENKKEFAIALQACQRHLWRSIYYAYISGTKKFICFGKIAFESLIGGKKTYSNSYSKTNVNVPSNVWNAVILENFCDENSIPYPDGMDGIDPDILFTPLFLSSPFITSVIARGFSFETPPSDMVAYSMPGTGYFMKMGSNGLACMKTYVRKICDSIEGRNTTDVESAPKDYKAIFNGSEAIDYIDSVINMYSDGLIPYVAYDLETVGPDGLESEGGLKPFMPGGHVLTINLSHKPDFGRVIYLTHKETQMTLIEQKGVCNKICELLSIVPIVGANLRFDLHWSRFKLGAKKFTIAHDTQLMSYASTLMASGNDLKTLTKVFLFEDSDYESELDAFLDSLPKEMRHYGMIPSSILTKYGCHDVDSVIKLLPLLKQNLIDREQYGNYEMFLLSPYPAFINMEQNGAHINSAELQPLIDDYGRRLLYPNAAFKSDPDFKPYYNAWSNYALNSGFKTNSKRKAKNTSLFAIDLIPQDEAEINFGSTEQVSILLYHIMKLPMPKKIGKPKKRLLSIFPKGVPSTDNDSLEELQGIVSETDSRAYKLVSMILQHRANTKAFSTYLKEAYEHCPVPHEKPDWWDNRHLLNDYRRYEAELYGINCQSPSFNITVTMTARTSCSDPNIQQVTKSMRCLYNPRPIEDKEGLIRKGLNPDLNKRRLIANFDVGQAELRMLASASQDPTMIAILSDPSRDIHRESASIAYGKPTSSITDEERAAVKSIVFGIIYGMHVKSMAAGLGISVEEAEHIKESIFRLMPNADAYLKDRMAEVDEIGGVYTPTGRFRDLSMYSDPGDRYRRAVNTPIQSAASDLTLYSVGQLFKWVSQANIQSSLWNFVHDSINWDVYPEELEKLMAMSRFYFCTMMPRQFTWYSVPLILEFELGMDWMRMVKCDYDSMTRVLTLKGKEDYLLPIYDTLSPVLENVDITTSGKNHICKGKFKW